MKKTKRPMDKIQTNRLNNNFQNTSQQNYFNVILQTEMTDYMYFK